MKLLVIQDDPEISELISLAFCVGRPDTEIVAVSSPDRGVELACEGGVDLVVIDLGLKNQAGVTAVKDIRLFSKVPIIVVADSNSRDHIPDALKLGADDSVVKPFELMEILAKICELVEKPPIKRPMPVQPARDNGKKSPPKYFGTLPHKPDHKTDQVTKV